MTMDVVTREIGGIWIAYYPGTVKFTGQGGSKQRAIGDLYRQMRGKAGPITGQQSPRTLDSSRTDRPPHKRS